MSIFFQQWLVQVYLEGTNVKSCIAQQLVQLVGIYTDGAKQTSKDFKQIKVPPLLDIYIFIWIKKKIVAFSPFESILEEYIDKYNYIYYK